VNEVIGLQARSIRAVLTTIAPMTESENDNPFIDWLRDRSRYDVSHGLALANASREVTGPVSYFTEC
jgi:hypothetical protein